MTAKEKFVIAVAAAAVAGCFRDLSAAQSEFDNALELRSAAQQQMQTCVSEWRAAGIKTLGAVGTDSNATALFAAIMDLKDDDGAQYYTEGSARNMVSNFRAALKTGRYDSNPAQTKARKKAKSKSATAKAIDKVTAAIKFIENAEDFKFDAAKVLAMLRDTERAMHKVVSAE